MIIELVGGPQDGATVHKYTRVPPPHHDIAVPAKWEAGLFARGGLVPAKIPDTVVMRRLRYVRTDTHTESGARRYVYEPMVKR